MQNITIHGREYTVTTEHDPDFGAPWEEHDGHGIVRECRTPHRYREGAKRAGEWPMNNPDRHCTQYFYDVAATIKKARADGWGLGEEARAALAAKLGCAPTAREIIAEAVRHDFEHLRSWLNDDWQWVYVKVTAPDGEYETVGGFESDDEEYVQEEAQSLAHSLDNAYQDRQTEEATI